jgi:hypothetical protein
MLRKYSARVGPSWYSGEWKRAQDLAVAVSDLPLL